MKLTLTHPSDVPEIVTIVPPVTNPFVGETDVIVGGLLPLQEASAACDATIAIMEKHKTDKIFKLSLRKV
ncbi:hypothetical protein MWN63_03385 [Paradonghicola geojensis]|nr:hypothetical protein [Marivivens geojensis]